MSGGVDSSVTAFLLKKQGYDLVGVFMRSYNLDGCAETDAEDARRVAGKLGIPFYVWDFEEEYKKKVVDYMVDGYRRGLTPNPDIMCNKEIKFGLFLEKALSLGADYVATGHYVRLRRNKLKVKNAKLKGSKLSTLYFQLYTARDAQKDQSYFLWTLTQKQLKQCLFPVGGYKKPEIRAIAKKAGLPTAEKKDSQGICFLGKVTLAEFLGSYLPAKEGAVFNSVGKEIGKHSGAHFFTIGQRHGLVSGDWKRTAGESKPFYVAEKNVRTNTITVAEGEHDDALFKKELELTDMNFINPDTHFLIRANKKMKVMARVRYRQPLAEATLIFANDAPINADKKHKSLRKSAYSPRGSALLVFEQSQKFVASGQSAVFYSADKGRNLPSRLSVGRQVLGGGIIK